MVKRLLALGLLLAAASCANLEPATPGQLPRGFSQPGSPFPYNSTGW